MRRDSRNWERLARTISCGPRSSPCLWSGCRPPRRELAGRVTALVGAGSGIGRVAAARLAAEGAHVVCIDLDPAGAKATADSIVAKQGAGIGVAGSAISGCGPAISVAADLTE